MATASDRCGIHRKKISENDLKKKDIVTVLILLEATTLYL